MAISDIEARGWIEAAMNLKEQVLQLERSCAALTFEVDRQRPVIDAAIGWIKYGSFEDTDRLIKAVNTYNERAGS